MTTSPYYDSGPLHGTGIDITTDPTQEAAMLGCADHNPVQHRDGKPPWCKECGLTATGHIPASLRAPKGTVKDGGAR